MANSKRNLKHRIKKTRRRPHKNGKKNLRTLNNRKTEQNPPESNNDNLTNNNDDKSEYEFDDYDEYSKFITWIFRLSEIPSHQNVCLSSADLSISTSDSELNTSHYNLRPAQLISYKCRSKALSPKEFKYKYPEIYRQVVEKENNLPNSVQRTTKRRIRFSDDIEYYSGEPKNKNIKLELQAVNSEEVTQTKKNIFGKAGTSLKDKNTKINEAGLGRARIRYDSEETDTEKDEAILEATKEKKNIYRKARTNLRGLNTKINEADLEETKTDQIRYDSEDTDAEKNDAILEETDAGKTEAVLEETMFRKARTSLNDKNTKSNVADLGETKADQIRYDSEETDAERNGAILEKTREKKNGLRKARTSLKGKNTKINEADLGETKTDQIGYDSEETDAGKNEAILEETKEKKNGLRKARTSLKGRSTQKNEAGLGETKNDQIRYDSEVTDAERNEAILEETKEKKNGLRKARTSLKGRSNQINETDLGETKTDQIRYGSKDTDAEKNDAILEETDAEKKEAILEKTKEKKNGLRKARTSVKGRSTQINETDLGETKTDQIRYGSEETDAGKNEAVPEETKEKKNGLRKARTSLKSKNTPIKGAGLRERKTDQIRYDSEVTDAERNEAILEETKEKKNGLRKARTTLKGKNTQINEAGLGETKTDQIRYGSEDTDADKNDSTLEETDAGKKEAVLEKTKEKNNGLRKAKTSLKGKNTPINGADLGETKTDQIRYDSEETEAERNEAILEETKEKKNGLRKARTSLKGKNTPINGADLGETKTDQIRYDSEETDAGKNEAVPEETKEKKNIFRRARTKLNESALGEFKTDQIRYNSDTNKNESNLEETKLGKFKTSLKYKGTQVNESALGEPKTSQIGCYLKEISANQIKTDLKEKRLRIKSTKRINIKSGATSAKQSKNDSGVANAEENTPKGDQLQILSREHKKAPQQRTKRTSVLSPAYSRVINSLVRKYVGVSNAEAIQGTSRTTAETNAEDLKEISQENETYSNEDDSLETSLRRVVGQEITDSLINPNLEYFEDADSETPTEICCTEIDQGQLNHFGSFEDQARKCQKETPEDNANPANSPEMWFSNQNGFTKIEDAQEALDLWTNQYDDITDPRNFEIHDDFKEKYCNKFLEGHQTVVEVLNNLKEVNNQTEINKCNNLNGQNRTSQTEINKISNEQIKTSHINNQTEVWENVVASNGLNQTSRVNNQTDIKQNVEEIPNSILIERNKTVSNIQVTELNGSEEEVVIEGLNVEVHLVFKGGPQKKQKLLISREKIGEDTNDQSSNKSERSILRVVFLD